MVLSHPEQMLLEAIRAAVRNERAAWEKPVSDADLTAFWTLARSHKLLPAAFAAVCGCESVRQSSLFDACKKQAALQIAQQTQKTSDFLSLYGAMQTAGFHPLVVKGIVCRSLWPNPDLRISADEDLLIAEEEFSSCCQWLRDYGLMPTGTPSEQSFEVGWRSESGPIYIELHKALFAPDSDALRDLNAFFADAHRNADILSTENGVQVLTLCPQEHLLYLLLHAYKHFIHSGFGLRQVCDIGLMARQYAGRIDWQQLYLQCAQAQILLFAAAVFQIARQVFEIQWELTDGWAEISVDHQPMLLDLIDGGVYGSSEPGRLHSASVTLNAVEAERRSVRSSILSSVFPSKSRLAGRYPILNRHPALLPIVWIDRLAKYAAECTKTNSGSARSSLQTAKQRRELLRLYGILP